MLRRSLPSWQGKSPCSFARPICPPACRAPRTRPAEAIISVGRGSRHPHRMGYTRRHYLHLAAWRRRASRDWFRPAAAVATLSRLGRSLAPPISARAGRVRSAPKAVSRSACPRSPKCRDIQGARDALECGGTRLRYATARQARSTTPLSAADAGALRSHTPRWKTFRPPCADSMSVSWRSRNSLPVGNTLGGAYLRLVDRDGNGREKAGHHSAKPRPTEWKARR